jgi:inosine/xanthosine triphosphate pyrophosphatase family protein
MGVADKQRTAQFRTVIAVASHNKPIKVFEGKLPGRILQEPIDMKVEGLPFQPLFYVTEYDLMLGDLHDMPIAEKLAKNIKTHRERAVEASLVYLATLNR